MNGHGSDITGLAIVVLGALAFGLAMRRFRQPPVLGYILAGAFLGPSGFALVENRNNVQILAELGVVMLLFIVGMELSLRGLKQVWKVALLTTLFQILAGLGAMYGLGVIMGWSLTLCVVLGFVVALSSTAVAIKMLEEIGEKGTRVGQITIGILIAQDFAVVPMMLIVGAMEGDSGGINLVAIVKIILSLTFLVLLVIYLNKTKKLRLPFIRSAITSVDLMPLAGLAFCFGGAALSGLLGLSTAYGAFLAGLVVGNSTSRTGMLRHTAPIQSILMMIFFLSIGLLIDGAYIWENLWTVLTIVTFVAVLKTALNIGLIRALGETWPRAFLSGALLAQLGEFSFVLAALGLSAGAVSYDNHRLIVAITVLSLVGSPFWLEAARRLHRIALLGITSGFETLRLTVGPEWSILRSTVRSDHNMVDMASSATRWMGEIVPRRRRPDRGPSGEPRA